MKDVVLLKQEIDQWLDDVDYSELNSARYTPSVFALTFMNFVKLVNGGTGETNKTPPFHLKMLDKAMEPHSHIVNLVFRGGAKTSLFMEYFTLYLAMVGELPGFGEVSGMLYVSDSMENGVKNARKNIETRYNNSEFLKEWVPEAFFTDKYLEFTNRDGHKLGVKMFGAMTGIRGSKIFAKRPTVAILDDLIGDSDATSVATMEAINDTVYSGLDYAMDPNHKKIIFNGTPFHKEDIIVKAVESGGWHVNVWPVCERFPCEKEDFVGAWEDRFSFDTLKKQYDFSVSNGKVASFMQELMLRITSEEDRLVQDSEIRWYSRVNLMEKRANFNFYITTDFATTSKQKSDYSVISVWAYNANGDWFWVDGVCARQTMDKSISDLFRFVQKYKPQSVGIEVSGQQGAFITWLQGEMMNRNTWFNFASNRGGSPGIYPIGDKLARFNIVVPWFKAGKIYFPEEMRKSVIMGLAMGQLRSVVVSGIKGKDDFIDTISMLASLNPWKPQESAYVPTDHEDDVWDEHLPVADTNSLRSYIV